MFHNAFITAIHQHSLIITDDLVLTDSEPEIAYRVQLFKYEDFLLFYFLTVNRISSGFDWSDKQKLTE